MPTNPKPFSDEELAEFRRNGWDMGRCMSDVAQNYNRFLDTIAKRDKVVATYIETDVNMKRALEKSWKDNAALTAEVDTLRRATPDGITEYHRLRHESLKAELDEGRGLLEDDRHLLIFFCKVYNKAEEFRDKVIKSLDKEHTAKMTFPAIQGIKNQIDVSNLGNLQFDQEAAKRAMDRITGYDLARTKEGK
jgi:hypothetical protein